jgi:hypothetical protein
MVEANAMETTLANNAARKIVCLHGEHMSGQHIEEPHSQTETEVNLRHCNTFL